MPSAGASDANPLASLDAQPAANQSQAMSSQESASGEVESDPKNGKPVQRKFIAPGLEFPVSFSPTVLSYLLLQPIRLTLSSSCCKWAWKFTTRSGLQGFRVYDALGFPGAWSMLTIFKREEQRSIGLHGRWRWRGLCPSQRFSLDRFNCCSAYEAKLLLSIIWRAVNKCKREDQSINMLLYGNILAENDEVRYSPGIG